MSKTLWFVVGLFVGELAGRWLTHFVYTTIIAVLLLSKHYCGA